MNEEETQENPSVDEKAPDTPAVADSEVKAVRPIRSTAREFTVTVPCGVWHDGKIHKRIRMTTVTAGDRRVFGDEKLRENPAKLMTRLLQSKIVGIEGLKAVPQDALRSCLSFDRDYLVYALRRETTKAKDFIEPWQCSVKGCGARNQSTFSCEEIDQTFREMPEDLVLRRENGKVVFEVVMPEYGFRGKFAYTDGVIQEHIAAIKRAEDNPVDTDFELLSALCIDFNGEGRLSPSGFAELEIDFVDDLQAEIEKHAYGITLNPTSRCYKCKTLNKVGVDLLDFLFDGLRRGQIQKTAT